MVATPISDADGSVLHTTIGILRGEIGETRGELRSIIREVSALQSSQRDIATELHKVADEITHLGEWRVGLEKTQDWTRARTIAIVSGGVSMFTTLLVLTINHFWR